jgi:hypothetical protein
MKQAILLPLTLLVIIFTPTQTTAQTPQAFKYQTVVRDASGQVLANQIVSFRIRILQGNIQGTSVYSETHLSTTNMYGLSNLEIGDGLVESGSFVAIDWSADQYFVQVSLDIAGGSNYQLMGVSQLLSVPYALHAQSADTVLNNPDPDPTNELQQLSLIGDTLSIENGNAVDLSGLSYPDPDSTNELQQLSLNGDTIFIENGNYIVIPGLGLVNFLGGLIDTTSTIQERLDAGQAPIALFNTGVPLDSIYGKTYKGGLIFFVDVLDSLPNIEGMVAAPVDQDTATRWGCFGTDIVGASNVTVFPPLGPGAKVGDGSGNTASILLGCAQTNCAARVASNYTGGGFMDWFLPSVLELDLMYDHIGAGAPAPNTNIGGFGPGFYWSSTEEAPGGAWAQEFAGSFKQAGNKNDDRAVRAIRAF